MGIAELRSVQFRSNASEDVSRLPSARSRSLARTFLRPSVPPLATLVSGQSSARERRRRSPRASRDRDLLPTATSSYIIIQTICHDGSRALQNRTRGHAYEMPRVQEHPRRVASKRTGLVAMFPLLPPRQKGLARRSSIVRDQLASPDGGRTAASRSWRRSRSRARSRSRSRADRHRLDQQSSGRRPRRPRR